jgi:tetratricopeptide (TPR) repeat protein
MYWWSNIAVPETKGTRVVVPAREAFYCGYSDGKYFLDKSPIPMIEGRDVTYASSSQRSRDFFFDIPNGREKWVAAIDENGKGLLQLSDPILKGRKLFVWGQHTGGRRWNEWLSDKAGAYIEIQAGLLKTQLEHFVMDADSTINWRECYCAIDVDPHDIHGDFDKADETVSEAARKRASLLAPDIFAITRADEIAAYGSGWGALENKIRQTPISRICAFPDDSMNNEQADWLALLDGKGLACHPESQPIDSYVVGSRWIELMEKVPSENWYYYNQLGVMRYADSDFAGAVNCFKRSAEITDNAWARRNLAMIQKNILGELDAAADNMLRAVALNPDYYQLTVECFAALIRAKRYNDLVSLYNRLPNGMKQEGRILMLLGECYSKMGRPEEARRVITAELVVSDLMEGEYSLSNIWIGIYAQVLASERGVSVDSLSTEEILSAYPLPREIDFRMH